MMGFYPPVYAPAPQFAGSTGVGFAADFSGSLAIANPAGGATTYDTITAVTIAVTPSDLTIGTYEIVSGAGGAGTAVAFAVSGGTAGTVYEVTFTLTTASGASLVRSGFIQCQ